MNTYVTFKIKLDNTLLYLFFLRGTFIGKYTRLFDLLDHRINLTVV